MGGRGKRGRVKKALSKGRYLIGSTKPPKVVKDAITRISRGRSLRSRMADSAMGKSPRRTAAVQASQVIPATDGNAKTASQSTQSVTVRKRTIGTTSLVQATSGTLPSKRNRSQVILYQSPFSVQAIPGSSKSPATTPIQHVNSKTLNPASKNAAISPQKKQDVSNKRNSNIKISPKNIKSIKKASKAKSSISAVGSAKKKGTTSKTKVKAQTKGKGELSSVVSKNNSTSKKRPVKPVCDDNTVSTSTEQDSKKEKKAAAKKPRAKLKSNDENNNEKVKTKRKGRAERLNPKTFVTEYLEDPTYRSLESIPHISTLVNSRLLIRAILLEDNELLESLLTNEWSICSLKIPRSLQTVTNALGYALERENLAAIKILVEKGKTIKLAPFPNLMIMEESTGSNSTYMLGHAVRSVQVGRGGKEGNSALLKDSGLYVNNYYNEYRGAPCVNNDAITTALKLGLKFSTIQELGKLGSSDVDHMCSENVITAIRFGHNQLAGEIVKHSRENDKWFSLNLLHEETLLNTTEPLTPFKAPSVIKKSRTDKLTPLHCAAINPNPDYLIQLLEVHPDMEVYDKHKFGPVHYAAVCSGKGPLEVLLSRGASIVQTTKAGDTPLLLAAATGRIENIKLILAHEKKTEHLNQSGKSVSCLEKKTKSGLTALQLAAEKGYLDAVKVLIDGGANPNGFTSADYGKLTPLMLAAQEGHLHIMKYLIEQGVKIDTVNLRGKSALTLAVMNGQAHIVSYLLRLGANHLIKDTSGNTLVHYAAAYGWYFNLKLLLEAGCTLNEGNTWKMTPVTIAFMKGHMGIVEFILQQCAVNINSIINDSNGATLLLQTCMGTPNSDYYSQIKFLLEEQKADVHVTDFDKNTAMHYVVKNAARTSEDETKKWILDTLKLLIDKGSNPDAKNAENKSPMNLAIRKNDFFLVQKLLEFNCPLSTETDEQGNNLLHNIMSNVYSDDAIELNKTCSENPKHLAIMREMVNVRNKNGDPPLFHLFRKNPNYQAKHQRLLDCLRFLLNTLGADVTVTDSEGKSYNLIFHVIVETGYTHSALDIVLPRHPNLEALDQHKQTPLAMAISKGDMPAAENLINAGANVNAKLPNGNSLLIELTKKFSTPHVGLFKLMIEKGANMLDKDIHNENTILHYMVRHSNNFEAIALVDQLIQAGVSINAVNGQGRTPLHVVINTRGGETDTNFEIEDLLIKAGAKLDIRDHRQRIPLHYAFVKINRHSDPSFMDPIELVSTLVGAMKNSVENFTQEIKQSDEFGKTPLHYAASRGASICCSYLSMLMNTEIDILDNNGNTPLGLAVYSGHEGCSVQFTQLGANFKLPLYSTPTHTSNTSTTIEKISWKWHCLTMRLEEEKKRIVTRNPSILEEVIKKDWQGILYLMLETLNKSGTGSSLAIAAAIHSGRLKLADKLVYRALPSELTTTKGDSLFHTVANCNLHDDFLVTRIVKGLVAKDVSLEILDADGSTALIRSSMQRNELLCRLFTGVSPKLENLINIVDKYGRNAFTALFWDISDHSHLSEKMQRWANMLLEQGLSSDTLCCYPIQVHHFPTVKYIRCHVQLKNSTPKYPPLIAAVIVKNYVIVQWLLTRGETKNFTIVDVNVKDSEGRTALMHAVRANDIKMVKLLLYPKYDHTKDLNPWEGVSGYHKFWTEWQNKRAANKISFEVQDKKGWNVTDYLVAANDHYYYVNASTILQLLGQHLPIQEASGDGTSPLEKAIKMNRVHLVESFEDFLKVDNNERVKFSTDFKDLFETDFKDAENLAVITDFEKDCKKMTEILVAKEEEDSKAKLDAAKESPTDLDPVLKADNEKFMYTIIMDENENIPYSCALTFVDLSYGEYGLYNFYKMQLVQQGRGNKLILLFTRWGRVGDTGQYQKTPYPSVDEAIKEFQKIFRSKTGNAWKDFKRFTPIENKYRLNDEDKSVKASVEVKIDFSKLSDISEHKKSTLPPEIHQFVRNISLVHSNEKFHKEISPHNITFQGYKKGDDILDKIAKLIETYDASKAAVSKVSENDAAKTELPPEEEINFKKAVQKLSEEFFAACPFNNFSKTKIEVLSSTDVLRYRKQIHGFVHLDLASQVFLGSLHNLPIMNPYEYIYRCLNIQMSLLEKNQQESQFILEYINNSDINVKVRNIFRIRRSGEKENFKSSGVGNPWLLWHGTANVNMLSILHRGLQIAPLETNWNGHLFGRGIYFADSFAKSSRYTRGNDKLYIFLCEVALGKIYPVTVPSAAEATTSQATISSYNSFKTSDSRWEPDPASTIIWNGRTVPLGRPIQRVQLDNYSYPRGLENNEYIVFNKNQVNLRYLIEFTTY